MKHLKFNLTTLSLLASPLIFAQGKTVRGEINQVLSNYILPMFIVFIVIAIMYGVVENFEDLTDKNGKPFKAIAKIALYGLYAIIATVIIGGVVVTIKAVNIQI